MRKTSCSSRSDSSVTYIFTAFVTLPNGQRIYAKFYGLKAFRIPVRAGKQ